MGTFLVTWSPGLFDWEPEYTRFVGQTLRGSNSAGRWSTGSREKGIEVSDRVFLLRQGVEPRGLVASGRFTSSVFQAPHWNAGASGLANYSEVAWDTVLDADHLLPLPALEAGVPGVSWRPRQGGTQLTAAAAAQLEKVWATHLSTVGRRKPVSAGRSAWLLLAVGEDRQHGGNDGYSDDPELTYRWDSTVPHHADLQTGDAIVLWDKKTSIGASIVERISIGSEKKMLKKCPHCGLAGIKSRKGKTPRYKCYRCAGLFDQPDLVSKEVTTYETRHHVAWVDLVGLLPAVKLRTLCHDPKSQQSMRPLRWELFRTAVEEAGSGPVLDLLAPPAAPLPGGHLRRTVRVRVGQAKFRQVLLGTYGLVCAFTGPGPLETLEAAHLYSYAETGQHHDDGGLLLRRDIHRLFDLGFLAVHPDELTVDVCQELNSYPLYSTLAGVSLHIDPNHRQRGWLRQHWDLHRS